MNNQQLWQAVLGELELLISRANFTTWFKNTFIASCEDKKVIVCVPNTFTKTWLEKKYHSAILKALENITQEKIKEILYKVDTIESSQRKNLLIEEKVSQYVPRETKIIDKTGLNPKYLFENFIVGKGNELAHAASQAIAQRPGEAYNPLFIYGGVGLGKTHLLQAIGHEILKKAKEKKVLYVTSERFTNEYIQAVKNGRGKEFKDVYRSIDILLIDDIQFIAGKEGTQEEFFHTFNALHQLNKQIVISSDRPPKAIPAMEARLLSRFEWGMIADIVSPDLETRIAILEAKCKEKNYNLDQDIIQNVAILIQNNIRELEGALNRIIAYHQLNNTIPTCENVKVLISSIQATTRKRTLTPKQFLNTVASFYDIEICDLTGKSREKKLAFPRQIIMYLMREEINLSFPAIGQELGGRDHTTAIHAHTKISKEIQENEKLTQDLDLIKQRLYNS